MLTGLSNQVEAHSRKETGTLRAIQVGGMAAALLLLGAIFLFFARNLRKERGGRDPVTRKETPGHSAHR